MTIPVGRVAKEGKASPPGMVLVKRFCPHRPYLLPSPQGCPTLSPGPPWQGAPGLGCSESLQELLGLTRARWKRKLRGKSEKTRQHQTKLQAPQNGFICCSFSLCYWAAMLITNFQQPLAEFCTKLLPVFSQRDAQTVSAAPIVLNLALPPCCDEMLLWLTQTSWTS